MAQGLKQEALAELHALAAENRFDPQGFYNIANAFARLDATDAAISAYRKAIDQRKGNYSRASNNLGVVLLRQGFLGSGLRSFSGSIAYGEFSLRRSELQPGPPVCSARRNGSCLTRVAPRSRRGSESQRCRASLKKRRKRTQC